MDRKLFRLCVLLFTFLLNDACLFAQTITTFAGGGTLLSDGVSALTANIHAPVSGAFDRQGNYYFAEANYGPVIRKITSAGIISTIAGSTAGFSGDGGPATAARFNGIEAIAVDTNGNVYVDDLNNSRIRRVDAITGIVTTYAGNGVRTSLGDGFPATSASLVPENVCVDRFGNVFVLDSASVVRKIDAAGIISTYAGNGTPGFSGDGGPATIAEIAESYGICTDTAGNLYIGCAGRIRKVDKNTKFISTIAGHGNDTYSGSENVTADLADFDPYEITIDLFGNIYIADLVERVYQVNTSNIFHTIAGNGIPGFSGDGGPATVAEIYNPTGVTTDTCGNLYISDGVNHRIRKVDLSQCDGTSLSVGNKITKSTVNVYPNPSTTLLFINSSNKITQINLTNLIGQTVFNQPYNTEKVEVDISGLPVGVYIVKVIGTDGHTTITKVIKQ